MITPSSPRTPIHLWHKEWQDTSQRAHFCGLEVVEKVLSHAPYLVSISAVLMIQSTAFEKQINKVIIKKKLYLIAVVVVTDIKQATRTRVSAYIKICAAPDKNSLIYNSASARHICHSVMIAQFGTCDLIILCTSMFQWCNRRNLDGMQVRVKVVKSSGSCMHQKREKNL